ncbi:MAG: TonB-dependent receptor [Hydrogenovibrio sp.]|uniref:TonB-dependent receptor n=1 Tax=Hydrogenovibrio sp. TaxID=2065821 RepID=UPI0028707557|nr:TonB-dependent receptor plug domain-containing protein [Hydrogenovibrio sp.]MDR9499761.1 TonB-dependent receptor [Hydrogenovibrio sp.]
MTSTHFSLKPLTAALIALMPASMAFAQTDPDSSQTQLTPVTVQADLRQSEADDMATSLHVYDSVDLQDQGASHTDDILLTTPNVNVSNQNARVRHIQIRGIGARDDYTGAPNSSVGLAIDGMDFSGLGGIGNLFDVKQVEVLRGPQNTRYGQAAIAGLVNIQTNEPTPYRESMVETSLGEYGHTEVGLMTSGPVSDAPDASQYRIAVFKHKSDGFYENDTLNRNDTNQKDELTLRGKLRVFASEDTTIDLSLLHANFDNGYDAWAKDNTFTTLSNQPGEDNQRSNAGSVKVTHTGAEAFDLISTTSLTNSDIDYGYDYDWDTDDFFFDNQKHHRQWTQDLRLVSSKPVTLGEQSFDWLAGVYASGMAESNDTLSVYYGEERGQSDYDHQKLAAYTQIDQALTSRDTLSYALRVETSRQDFTLDKVSYGTPVSNDFDTDETLWGGSLAYARNLTQSLTGYASVTRGFKAGGFNTGSNVTDPDQLWYDAETLWNYETGIKADWLDKALHTDVTAFYMDRDNPQMDGYTYLGAEYVFYKENLDSAKNYGLEASFDWQMTPQWQTFGSLGLLYTDVEGTPLNSSLEVSGRDQSHAPNYQFQIGAQYRHGSGFFARADMRGLDSFYFDNVHNARSESYQLYNARIGFEAKDWEVYAWGKNLTDERYATRGFYNAFSQNQTYIRLGDPRQFGLTARVYF